jgi:hypothetical protein
VLLHVQRRRFTFLRRVLAIYIPIRVTFELEVLDMVMLGELTISAIWGYGLLQFQGQVTSIKLLQVMRMLIWMR